MENPQPQPQMKWPGDPRSPKCVSTEPQDIGGELQGDHSVLPKRHGPEIYGPSFLCTENKRGKKKGKTDGGHRGSGIDEV